MMRGYGFYDGYGMMGGGWLGLLVMLAFWMLIVVGLVVLVVWAVRSMRHHGAGMPMAGPGPHMMSAHDEAVAIARKRYASGEITKEQYDELMKGLG